MYRYNLLISVYVTYHIYHYKLLPQHTSLMYVHFYPTINYYNYAIYLVIIVRYQIIKFKLQFPEFTKFGVNGEMYVNRANTVTREGSLGPK